jgi:ribonucleoside-diphosphate reductase alpha chain
LSEAESLKSSPLTAEGQAAVAADASIAVDVSADEAAVVEHTAKPVPGGAQTSAELLEVLSGREVDSPLCFTCGTKMRPAGSCYVCEGCGSTSGCS